MANILVSKRADVIHEIVRRSITRMVEDVIREAVRNLNDVAPQSVQEIRMAGRCLVGFSADMTAAEKEVKRFLFAPGLPA